MAQGEVTKGWVSLTPYLDDRDILPQLIDITNEQASLVDIMEILGHSSLTIESQYHHIVNSELFQPGVVASSSGAPGTTVTVVLTNATAGACIGNSIAMLKSGARAFVKTNASGTLTLNSIDGTNIASADVADGVSMVFPSVAFGEGSYGASPEKFSKESYTNVAQIFKQSYEITDVQMASRTTVDVNGDFLYQNIQRIESYLKFRKYISLGMIINTYSGDNFSAATPSLEDSGGNAVNVTRGLDQYVTERGISYPLVTSTSIDVADMQNLDTTLNNIRAPKRYMVYCSTPMNQKFDIFLNALNNSSQLSQAGRFLIEGETLDLGISSFRFFNRDYYKMSLPIMDDRNTLGYSGVGNISTSAYLCPLGMIKTVGNGDQPYISTRYMNIPGTRDLRYFEQHTGGMVEPITTTQAVDNVNYYSLQGLQVLGANFFVKMTES